MKSLSTTKAEQHKMSASVMSLRRVLIRSEEQIQRIRRENKRLIAKLLLLFSSLEPLGSKTTGKSILKEHEG